MFAVPASSKVNALGVRAAVHHDSDQFWLDRLCRASSLSSNDLGWSFCLSSLTELFFNVSSFNGKSQRRSEKPARLHTKWEWSVVMDCSALSKCLRTHRFFRSSQNKATCLHGRSKKPARFYRLTARPPMLRSTCSSPSNAEDKRFRVYACYFVSGCN